MTAPLEYEQIGNETECGKILNTYFVNINRGGYLRVKGNVVPDHFPKFGDRLKQLDIRDEDVFVCGNLKTGSTWVREMVWCIANDLDYEGARTNLGERFPLLELSAFYDFERIKRGRPEMPLGEYEIDSIKMIDETRSPRFIKSHLPFDLLPEKLTNFSTKAKIIYICRNPKDACVSQYHYSQFLIGYTGDFDQFCKLFLNDMLTLSPFWKHILAFWELRNKENVLFLKYEDMKKDLPSVIRKTARFLNKSLSDEQVTQLASHLSFESMKKNRAVNFEPRMEFHRKYNLVGKEGAFMRKGSVGGWKEEMTPQVIKQFDSWTKEKTAGTDFQFPC